MMTKLEAIVQPSRFEAVKEVLTELGIGGMTISDVRGHGRQKGHTEVYRGREYTVDLLPKIKIEIVIPDNLVDAAIDAILAKRVDRQNRRWKDFCFQGGSSHSDTEPGAWSLRAVVPDHDQPFATRNLKSKVFLYSTDSSVQGAGSARLPCVSKGSPRKYKTGGGLISRI